jgi:hypothetical protein
MTALCQRNIHNERTKIREWKTIMIEHAKICPLQLINENFFIPLKRISITSITTREQDVIAYLIN